VVLMAGGKGERLRPLTADCPKPMLAIGGKPMLEIILQQCVEAGFKHFYLSVNYLKQQIIDHFGDGSHWGVEVRYLEEHSPLGTGGALGLLPQIPEHPLLVMNGDVLTRVDFKQLMNFHQEHAAEATMCVREHVTQIPYGVVQLNGTNVAGLEEKPLLSHFVNAGIYVLNPSVLALLEPHKACDMPNLLKRTKERGGQVSAFPIHEYWLDIGHPETLQQAHGEWQ
jgi:NDP-sugar pyrophosphorylase family protein